MGIIEILIAIFLICAAWAAINAAFGPLPIPPRLMQVAVIIIFVIVVLVVLNYFGYGPGLGLH